MGSDVRECLMSAIPVVTGTVRAKIDEMIRRIVEHERPEKIVLFGSRATGQARPDSDVDVMVVVRGEEDPRPIAVRLYRLLAGTGIPKDIMVVTTHEFETQRRMPGTVVYAAAHEGQVLYERPA